MIVTVLEALKLKKPFVIIDGDESVIEIKKSSIYMNFQDTLYLVNPVIKRETICLSILEKKCVVINEDACRVGLSNRNSKYQYYVDKYNGKTELAYKSESFDLEYAVKVAMGRKFGHLSFNVLKIEVK